MAEVVRTLPPAADAPEPWVQPIREGVWVDPNGTHWKLRRSLSLQRIERLLKTSDVEVLFATAPTAPVGFRSLSGGIFGSGRCPTWRAGRGLAVITLISPSVSSRTVRGLS
jgi:hypothetical protein